MKPLQTSIASVFTANTVEETVDFYTFEATHLKAQLPYDSLDINVTNWMYCCLSMVGSTIRQDPFCGRFLQYNLNMTLFFGITSDNYHRFYYNHLQSFIPTELKCLHSCTQLVKGYIILLINTQITSHCHQHGHTRGVCCVQVA